MTATSTKYESAKLILELYDLRREEKMRESRSWWWTFNPKTIGDFKAVWDGPDSAKMSQASAYWEMAAALVNHGAIDESMFVDTNGEYLFLFAKVQPFLAELREEDPRMFVQLEKLIMRMPDADKMLESFREMMADWQK